MPYRFWGLLDSCLAAMESIFCELPNGQEQDERMATVMEKALPKQLVAFLTPDTDVYATVPVSYTHLTLPTN